MPSLGQFIREQRMTLPIIPSTQDCKGKTYIVTGSNTGLGLECAKHFVQLSASKVILAVRTISKGEAAKARIEQETDRKDVVEVWPLDLCSSESTIAFADKVKKLDRIDAIVENASVALLQRTETEGVETTLTVNVVNTFLLALLVLPKLRECAKTFKIQPHLVIVGSEVAFGIKGVLEKVSGDVLDGLTAQGQSAMSQRYQASKLLQFYAMRQLASLHSATDSEAIINLVNPGLCKTELARNAPFVLSVVIFVMRLLLGRTAEEGSRNLLYAAVAGSASDGKYVSACQIQDFSVPEWAKDDRSKHMQQQVWESLTKRVEAVQPGCVNAAIGSKDN